MSAKKRRQCNVSFSMSLPAVVAAVVVVVVVAVNCYCFFVVIVVSNNFCHSVQILYITGSTSVIPNLT